MDGFSPPRTDRDLFDLLSRSYPSADLDEILTLVQWTRKRQVGLLEIVRSLLVVGPRGGRKPKFDCLRSAKSWLYSSDFQGSVVAALLDAYPEKRRLVFVHIPKCAGSDLAILLERTLPRVYMDIANEEVTKKELLFSHLAAIVARIKASDAVIVHGHTPLTQYIQQGYYRPGDDLFTVVRDPIARIVSQVNYIVRRICSEDPVDSQFSDRLGWMRMLGIEEQDVTRDERFKRDCAREVLFDPRMVTPNTLCRFLGGETYDDALQAIVGSAIEITDIRRYDDWLRTRWDIGQSLRANSSPTVIDIGDLADDERDYVEAISTEDIRLFATIERSLDRGHVSVRGSELAAQV